MLNVEAMYPVSHFVATDGSRKPREKEEPPKVGRVSVMHDGEELRIFGGGMNTALNGFEKHS